jgi:phosphatidylethanolamine/phosphatidyl-N-methylethanolamine N-methyltransferase
MSQKTIAFYNHFSFFYPLVELLLKPQKRILFKEVNRIPNGKLLEIGVGNGSHLSQYAKHDVTGIDTSKNMLDIARKNHCGSISLLEMNGEELLFDNDTFDYLVLSHVIAVVDNPAKLISEAYRVLKPGGRLFILNHFTPVNWLKYIDLGFQPIARYFHFNSVFRIEDLPSLGKFELKKQIGIGAASYFKLLIYQKP